MALIKSSDIYPAFPSWVNHFLGGDLLDWASSNYSHTNTTLPAVNIAESENDFSIEVAAPGMRKEDFKINFDGGTLTISSEHQAEKKRDKKEGRYSRHEFSYQSFNRSFSIPDNLVDGDKIQAQYNNGILKISLPKREEVKPRPPKQIAIA